jgi:hypothetical protein
MIRDPGTVIPTLPSDEIRAAADAGDWTCTAELVDGHEHAVRAAFVDAAAVESPACWLELLAEQQALMTELRERRDQASDALRLLQHERRSAHLYLSQAALSGLSE